VRYSLESPQTYIDSNITGFLNILEACRHNPVEHLVYASSSSVYGLNQNMPFSVQDNVDHPVSLYAASKKSNELMAHTYSHLFNIPTTGLRFFTVYGPWGRPDMALFLFTKSILAHEPIDVFNNGEMLRDFTYVEDIVESIKRLIPIAPSGRADFDRSNPDPSISSAPYTIFNIGNNSPVKLLDFIKAIEEETGIEAVKNLLPLQPGDVPATYANVNSLFETINFKPKTTIQEGIHEFVKWYRDYYKV
jgi:UDP-glucuronate 4-epimerase